jgi:hypothetical protein
MGKHFQAKFNRITNITTPMPDKPNEPLTDSLDALPPMIPHYIEQQAKKAAKAVQDLERQEAAEALAALQHGRPPQAPNNNMPKGKEPITIQEYKEVQEQQERGQGRPIGRAGQAWRRGHGDGIYKNI